MTAFEELERHLQRGDRDRLDDQIATVVDRLRDDTFEDAFKGVFQQDEVPTEAVSELVAFLTDQREKVP